MLHCGRLWSQNLSRIISIEHSITQRYITTSAGAPRVCVVGAGPAGFYTAQQILKLHPTVTVDILERLPVPFGLVRFGVAPDHQEVKNVIGTFTQTAGNDRCRFIGNVTVGADVSIAELKSLYDAVALSYGAATDRDLGVPGESLRGVIPARRFVGWYNGVPEDRDLNPDLSRSESAVIVGQGNVALDIARILLTPRNTLSQTDITNYSLAARESTSKIKNVYIVGRRGPLQVAFTIKELREMIKLPNCATSIDEPGGEQLKLAKANMKVIPRPRKRLTELLIKTAEEGVDERRDARVNLIFLRSPVEIVGDENGYVKSIRLGLNELVGPLGEDQSVKPHPGGDVIEIPCGLVIKSIGYKSVNIDGDIPFDLKKGIIPNIRGRVERSPGLYCSGWVSRGPTGVVATTMSDAFEAGKVIVDDLEKGVIQRTETGDKSIVDLLESRNIRAVTFSDWEILDAYERSNGEKVGKPREKLTVVADIFGILDNPNQ